MTVGILLNEFIYFALNITLPIQKTLPVETTRTRNNVSRHLISSIQPSLYFFPKKLMIFPCPTLPPPFFPFPILEAVEVGVLSFCGGGSSSEKDSHAGSSLVTVRSS